MPVEIRYKFNNPFFNEFVFLTIISAPQEMVNRLPTSLIKHTNSPERAKYFADKASLERKLEMVSRLGGAFSLSVHPPDYMNKEKLQEIGDNYLAGKRLNDVDDMLANKVFVQTDREIMAIYAIMAMNCHHETYMVNRDYSLLGAKIQWDKDIDPRIADIELIKDVMSDYKLLCKLILYVLLNPHVIDAQTAYNTKDILLLLFLFLHRNEYVRIKTMQRFFDGVYASQVISTTLYRLSRNNIVTRFPNQYRYAIGGLGIQILATFVNRIVNQTLNF